MPPLPDPQFEVAVLKMSPPGANQNRAQVRPTGQVDISGAPLNRIIGLAWNLTDGGARVAEDAYLVGPKWLETARIDVTARAFADTNPANLTPTDEDVVRLMLRSLLIQKLQIKWHMEDRPMPGFTMVADNPKMTKGDPARRTRCFEGAAAGSLLAEKQPQFPRLVTCQNITMEQFGQLLPNIANGYTRVAAIDKTGLRVVTISRSTSVRSSNCLGPGPMLALPTQVRRSTQPGGCRCRTRSDGSLVSSWRT